MLKSSLRSKSQSKWWSELNDMYIPSSIPSNILALLCTPRNMGAYSYCLPRIMTATRVINGDEKRARYVGRTVSAAPATGMGSVHKLEYQQIMEGVYGPAVPKFEGD